MSSENPCVIGFIQARLTSSRLPNKVLAKIGPWSSIELMLLRLSRCRLLNQVIFVIPDTPANDPLADYLSRELRVKFVRGNEDDVLQRFIVAAGHNDADYYVRLTADCPLICPELVDDVIRCAIANKLAYATNTYPPSFPDGFDVECISKEALIWTDQNTRNPHWREHVTLGFREASNRPNHFKIANVTQTPSYHDVRLTLDKPEDLMVFMRLFDQYNLELEHTDHRQLQQAYVDLRLNTINGNNERNEGLELSKKLYAKK